MADELTKSEKALLVATCAAGILASHESWRAFEHESEEGQSLEDWATMRGFQMAKGIVDRIG